MPYLLYGRNISGLYQHLCAWLNAASWNITDTPKTQQGYCASYYCEQFITNHYAGNEFCTMNLTPILLAMRPIKGLSASYININNIGTTFSIKIFPNYTHTHYIQIVSHYHSLS